MSAFKGLGTYGNAVGVVTPLDHKEAQAGQVVKASGNLIRPGLFWGGSATIITGKANMSYDVAAYTCVTTRSATAGAVFGGNDGTVNVATTAAPGSNSRIDIIYHWHREYSLDGTDSNPVIGVVQGTAAAVPTAPSLAAFPGAIEIGRATVAAGITSTTSATITQTAPFTAMAGGIVQVRNTTERDAGTWAVGQTIRLLDTKTIQTWDGSAWISVGSPRHARYTYSRSVANTTSTTLSSAPTISTGDSMADYASFYTANVDGTITFQQAGVYTVTITASLGTVATGRSFLQIGLGTPTFRAPNTSEDQWTVSATIYVPASTALTTTIFQTTGGTRTVTGNILITRHGDLS